MKKRFILTILLVITILFLVVFNHAGGDNETLTGDDKIAFDYLYSVIYKFKDPASVKVLSGSVHTPKNKPKGPKWVHLTISATNSFGGRVQSCYDLYSKGEIDKINGCYPRHTTTDQLDVETINKALSRKLKQ